MKRTEFIIPGDIVKELGPNALMSAHWAEKGRRVERWKLAAWLVWREAGAVQFDRRVHITFCIRRGRTVDQDNALASCKAALDGLRGPERMIPDDSEKWIASLSVIVTSGKVYRENPEVLVSVEEE